MSAFIDHRPAAGPRKDPGMRHFAAVIIAALAAAAGFSALAAEGGKTIRQATYVQIELGDQPAADRLTTILVTPASARTVQ